MKAYVCTICKFRTGSRKEIRKHVREVHKKRGKRWKDKARGPTHRKGRVLSDITQSYEAIEV